MLLLFLFFILTEELIIHIIGSFLYLCYNDFIDLKVVAARKESLNHEFINNS